MTLRDQALDAANKAIEGAPVEHWLGSLVDAAEKLSQGHALGSVVQPIWDGLRSYEDSLAGAARGEVLHMLSRFAIGEPFVVPETLAERLDARRAASAELHADTLARKARRQAMADAFMAIGRTAASGAILFLTASAKEAIGG